MLSYVFLGAAIVFEVSGTMLLPLTQQFTKLIPTVILSVCYLLSFYLLTHAIKTIPISIAYATWSGLGVFLIALFGYLFFKQALNWQTIAGLCLIVLGVIIVNTHSTTHA